LNVDSIYFFTKAKSVLLFDLRVLEGAIKYFSSKYYFKIFFLKILL